MPNVTFLEAGTAATYGTEFYDTISGTVTSDGSITRNNSRALKLAANATAQASGVLNNAGRRLTTYVQLGATPSGDAEFLSFGTDFDIGVRVDGHIFFANAFGTKDSSAILFTFDSAWHRVAVAYVITSATNWTVKVWWDNVLVITASNADFNIGTGATDFHFRGPNAALYVSDVYIDDGTTLDDPGAVNVTPKLPFANGTTTGMSLSGVAGPYGSGHAAYVNQRPLDTTAQAFRNGTGPITEEYTIEAAAVGDVNLAGATLLGVRGWVYVDGAPNSTAQIVVDGTQTAIAVTATKTLFTQNSATPTVYPAGTGADIGVITNAANVITSLYECGVLVAYIAGRRFFLIPS